MVAHWPPPAPHAPYTLPGWHVPFEQQPPLQIEVTPSQELEQVCDEVLHAGASAGQPAPEMQRHVPAKQPCPAMHGVQFGPQALASLGTQAPAHRCAPPEHWHAPPSHTVPPVHMLLHAPQFCGSLSLLVHMLPQASGFATVGQIHAPPVQSCAGLQAESHSPTLASPSGCSASAEPLEGVGASGEASGIAGGAVALDDAVDMDVLAPLGLELLDAELRVIELLELVDVLVPLASNPPAELPVLELPLEPPTVELELEPTLTPPPSARVPSPIPRIESQPTRLRPRSAVRRRVAQRPNGRITTSPSRSGRPFSNSCSAQRSRVHGGRPPTS